MSAVEPAHVLITGATGRIGYVLSTWIASGDLYGDRPVVLHLFGRATSQPRLDALVMELTDCAFPTLAGVVATSDPAAAFSGVDCAFLIASAPVQSHMRRSDLLAANAPIFRRTGEWLSAYAKPTCKSLVISNPDNTNALVAQLHCANIPRANFHSLSQLDMSRAVAALAARAGVPPAAVSGAYVWGNHGDTMVADLSHASFVRGGAPVSVGSVETAAYTEGEFPAAIKDRGFVVMSALGRPAVGSPAWAALQHMRAWLFGTRAGEVLSMGIPAPGGNPYGISADIVFAFPCTVGSDGEVHIVEGLEISEWLRARLLETERDLLQERAAALHALEEADA